MHLYRNKNSKTMFDVCACNGGFNVNFVHALPGCPAILVFLISLKMP